MGCNSAAEAGCRRFRGPTTPRGLAEGLHLYDSLPGKRQGGDAALAGGQTNEPGNSAPTVGGHNLWDFLIVAFVIGALVAITIFLVKHFAKPSDAASILGIVVPAFAAVFGVTLGYATGTTTGKATGKEQGKQEVKNSLTPKLDDIATTAEGLVGRLRASTVNPEGSDVWRLQKDLTVEPIDFEPEKLELPAKIASVRSYLDAL
jgi:hypothetical protein